MQGSMYLKGLANSYNHLTLLRHKGSQRQAPRILMWKMRKKSAQDPRYKLTCNNQSSSRTKFELVTGFFHAYLLISNCSTLKRIKKILMSFRNYNY